MLRRLRFCAGRRGMVRNQAGRGNSVAEFGKHRVRASSKLTDSVLRRSRFM